MTPIEALSQIDELAALNLVSPSWDDSASFCSDPAKMDSLLALGEIAANASFCGLDAAVAGQLQDFAGQVRKSPALSRLLGHVFFANFLKEGPSLAEPAGWPLFDTSTDGKGACVYLLAALAYAPLLKARHRRLGIPEDVTRETASQISCFVANYFKGRKALGVYTGQFFWLRNYVWSLYLRLGRFEFWYKPYQGFDIVCRSKDGSKLVNFARPGLRIGADGYALDDLAVPPEHVWTTSSSMDAEFVCGNPVGVDGRPSREQLKLSLDSWDIVMRNGTPVLDMHIPAGGGMAPEDCLASFRKAKSFFAERFPELKPEAVVCMSWIFNPNLPEILPASSNLVKLLKEVHLFPIASGATDGLWFIFLMDKFDLATASRETSLQRAILDYIASGRRWRTGGMFLPLSEIK